MKYLMFIITICICHLGFSQSSNDVIHIAEDVEAIKLSENIFIHKTYKITEKWGRISANGVIFIEGKEAFLFDTPWTESQTETLVSWLKDSLNINIMGFVPSHWHEDCIGGLECIKQHSIRSYANQMTIDIAKSKELPIPEIGFKDSLQLQLGNKTIDCYYFGAAHSLDNIIVSIPSESLLFAGCTLKGLDYKNIGFTGDGDLDEYPKTLHKILSRFPKVEIVIPGHGDYGDVEVIKHNLQLLSK